MKPQRAELQATELKGDELQTVDIQTVDPKTVEAQTIEPHMIKFQTVKPQKIKNQTTEPQKVDLQNLLRQVNESQNSLKEDNEGQTSLQEDNEGQTSLQEDNEGQTSLQENNYSQNSLQEDNERQPSAELFSDHKSLVLWHRPTLTLLYFFKELSIHIRDSILKILHCHRIIEITVTLLITVIFLNSTHCPNHPTLFLLQKRLLWCLYWFSLGMLSSIGLGTGIHTFALYLGPYIASVTVAANECGYLNFTEDSYTGVIECPHDPDPRWAVTLWNIMCKVRMESYMWGLGTAVGELPPYFMGRAARISGQEEGSDVLREFEELQRKKDESPETLTRLDRIKLLVRYLVVRAGFWGILICASIPNPFFDLAGIICGNFFVPFWTFFGATLIGKALIKTTVQQVFIILSFNKAFLEKIVEILPKIPLVGQRGQMYLSHYIAKQKEKFHKSGVGDSPGNGLFSKAYHTFVICTFLYFFISIINSLAQNHYKRLKRERLKKNE